MTPTDKSEKAGEFFILTQAGCLPFNVVKTEGEAVEICAMVRRSNEPDFIHVIEMSEHQRVLGLLRECIESMDDVIGMELRTHGRLSDSTGLGSAIINLNSVLKKLKEVTK